MPKSRKAPKQVQRLLEQGAEHFFVWGGDGMAQRCIDTLAGTGATMAIVPAGTANLLASNLGIPKDIEGAVMTGLHGRRRPIDVASMNGERFAVMAGAGFDADMIGGADGTLKDRFGRAAYIWTGRQEHAHAVVQGLDQGRRQRPGTTGRRAASSPATSASLFAGVEVFADAEPDDGRLDIAVITAEGLAEWARTVARTVAGSPERSPVLPGHARRSKVKVKLDRKVPYELDGGARDEGEGLPARGRAGRDHGAACPHPTTATEAEGQMSSIAGRGPGGGQGAQRTARRSRRWPGSASSPAA